MERSAGKHPSPVELAAFGLGQLTPQKQAAIAAHVTDCETCCNALRAVPDDTLLARMRAVRTPPELQVIRPGNVQGAAVSTDLLLPPELVDHPRYKIVRILGNGGMGTVYQAEHRLMERQVALKVISREFTSHPTAVERFLLEVKAAGRLNHPNIVAAHDAEQAGDLHFLVTEYVDGASLDRVVEKRGPLPLVYACNYIRQAALGLQHAADRGMVHRDIKPHNLILARKGQVKILDFGLARFARERSRADTQVANGPIPRLADSITAAGMVLGTPDYIAPEQVNNSSHVDVRADIYSLGCTFYFLLAGQPPFPRGSAIEKVLAHVDVAPQPLTELRSDVPTEVLNILDRMMAKDPARRYQTPIEVAQALAPFARLSPAAAGEPMLPMAEVVEPRASAPAVKPAPAQSALTPAETLARPVTQASTVAMQAPRKRRFKPKRPERPWIRYLVATAAASLVLLLAGWGIWYGVENFLPRGPGNQSGPALGGSAGGVSNPAAIGVGVPGNPALSPIGSGKETVPSSATSATASGSAPRVLYVLPSTGVWYADYKPVRDYLESHGVKVDVASSQRGECQLQPGQSATAEPVRADLALKEVRAADYDAIVFGGFDVREFTEERLPSGQAVRRLMDEMRAERKIIAALCIGQVVLAKNGKLRGQKAAYNDKVKQVSPGSGADWQDRPVVVSDDGLIVTGAHPDHAKLFAKTLLTELRRTR